MKKNLIIAAILSALILLPFVTVAQNITSVKNSQITSSIQGNNSQKIESEADKNDTIGEIARRGCCSWHNGVCGCDESTNRIQCCDGTLSPSCTCSGY